MDDQNGECFEHHEDLFAPINTSDSEHECLKEFLLEPENVSRNVPFRTDTNDLLNSLTSTSNHVEPKIQSQTLLDDQSAFQTSVDSVNASSSLTDDSVLSNDYSDIVNSHGDILGNNTADVCLEHSRETLRENNRGSPNSNTDNKSLDSLGELSGDRKEDVRPKRPRRRTTRRTEESSRLFLAAQDSEDGDDAGDDISVTSHLLDAEPGNSHQDVSENKGEGLVNSHFVAETPVAPRGRGNSRGRKRKAESCRGRPPGPGKKRNRQQVTTYQSQISPDQNGIKLRIKMSSGKVLAQPTRRRERGRKRRSRRSSTTTEDEGEESKRVRWKAESDSEEPAEEIRKQSGWGHTMPVPIIERIFMMVTQEEGCVPFLFRMSRVCRLWRGVALSPFLWHTIDLSGPLVKERYKNTEVFRWLCENRLTRVQDLNIDIKYVNHLKKVGKTPSKLQPRKTLPKLKGGWKCMRIQIALESLCTNCRELRGLGLNGWMGLTADHLKYLVANCPHLARLDLSSINQESSSRGAVSLISLTHVAQEMGERLTHLVLADNKLAGLPQIVTAIATYCPNLQVLDLSNLRTHTTAPLHIERLQEGCQKLRVLRITNSTVALSATSLQEQVAAPGFPALEELSVATVANIDGLSSTTIMDDNSVERILKNSHKLRLLDVRGCSRVTDSSLVRVPAWDLEHLFLSGCYVTRLNDSGLDLIARKWKHSLVEVDLGWSTATKSLDLAVSTLAEKGDESPLRVLNLCGSSVSLAPVKEVLLRCHNLVSLNLSSCRALPRGIKRLYEGEKEVSELRESFEEKPPAKTEEEEEEETGVMAQEGEEGATKEDTQAREPGPPSEGAPDTEQPAADATSEQGDGSHVAD